VAQQFVLFSSYQLAHFCTSNLQKKHAYMTTNLNLKLIAVIVLLLNTFSSRAQQFDWAKSVRGGYESVGNAIATDNADNVITTGFYSGHADFNPAADSTVFESISLTNDIYLQKLDSGGIFSWAKTMGGDDIDAGNAVTTDAQGNIFVAGYFSSTAEFNPGGVSTTAVSAGNTDAFICKFSPAGNLLWVKTFGGTGADAVTGIVLDRNNNIYLTGYFSDNADMDPSANINNITATGSKDIFVLKLDFSGTFIWAKGMGSTDDDIATGLALDTAQYIVFAGSYSGTVNFDPNGGTTNLISNGYSDAFVAKLSSAGNLLWAKGVGSVDFEDGVRAVGVDINNNTVLTGFYRGTTDFDPGVGVASFSWSSYNDIFVLKLTAAGGYLWAKTANGSSWEEGYGLTLDGAGNIYTTGYFESSLDFDPNAGTVILDPNAYSDVYVQKLSPAGNLMWVKSVSGTGSDGGNGIALDTKGNVYTTGYFSNTADFDPNNTVYNLPVDANQQSAFVFKWFQTIPTAINEPGTTIKCNAFPNPTSNTLNIHLDKIYKTINAFVYDEVGHLIKTENFNTIQQPALNLQELSAGLYFVHLQADENTAVIRIIKN
jgi:hypothetical protein